MLRLSDKDYTGSLLTAAYIIKQIQKFYMVCQAIKCFVKSS